VTPSAIRKSPAKIRTLGKHTDEGITAAIVQSICEVFENQLLYRNPEVDQWHIGKALFEKKTRFFVESRAPILFCLPAFPCKSSNQDKVASKRPDGVEFEALITLYRFAEAVRRIYPPGCVIEIVSDGHVFSDCVGTDDDVVTEYNQQFQAMAAAVRAFLFRSTGDNHDGLVTFQNVHQLLFPLKCVKTFYREEFAQINEVCHPVTTQLTAHDNRNRGLLLHSCGACQTVLERVLKMGINPGLTLLYRGFARFMLDDLAYHPDGQNKTKSQRKRMAEEVALEMMKRNQAYSHLVELVMPRHIRLSIHAHNNSGPKFAISLLPTSKFRHLDSFDTLRPSSRVVDFEARHHLHIPTPWHNTLLQIDGDDKVYVCKAGLIKAELDKEDSIWDAESGYVADHERGGRYILYRSGSTARPSPRIEGQGEESQDLYA
jgi:pyoverdine/dityrosine biosynthesis protein Dit1